MECGTRGELPVIVVVESPLGVDEERDALPANGDRGRLDEAVADVAGGVVGADGVGGDEVAEPRALMPWRQYCRASSSWLMLLFRGGCTGFVFSPPIAWSDRAIVVSATARGRDEGREKNRGGT
jgi:hypothetical protein